ncbi:MAG TPA: SPOR domain-containing protein [Aliiroseovarius sp.]|nr:SPOR domain-containing protein [Aliiroseovarius sp.]
MNNAQWGDPGAAQHDSRYDSRFDASAQPAHPHYPQHQAGQYQAGQYQAGQYTQHQQGQYHAGYPNTAQAVYSQPQTQPAGGAGADAGRLLHGGGALLSAALIAGLAVWGYQLAVRALSGVPVVRALQGPRRVQPEDPGGVAAAHLGFSVNAVAADGQAEGPVAQVALAPAPAALAVEDTPARSGAEVSAVTMAEAGEAAAFEAAPENATLAQDQPEDMQGAALAMANALTAGVAPLSGEAADLSLTPEAAERLASANAPGIIPSTVPGVVRSPRPRSRPDDIVARAATSPVELALASASTEAPVGVREVDASQIAAGTRLVQLGAFDGQGVARAEWNKIAARFPEMLEGKERVIEQAQSGGKTFYRLRAMGFDDLSDARRFCATLMAGQAACIPVVTR